MADVMQGRAVVPGEARGEALVGAAPLSFWGGLDAQTGEIIDRRHSLSGQNATGRVLVLPAERGSSTASAVLMESIRLNTPPAAIVTRATAPILALGAVVAQELYGRTVPMVVLGEEDFARIRTGAILSVRPDGTVTVETN